MEGTHNLLISIQHTFHSVTMTTTQSCCVHALGNHNMVACVHVLLCAHTSVYPCMPPCARASVCMCFCVPCALCVWAGKTRRRLTTIICTFNRPPPPIGGSYGCGHLSCYGFDTVPREILLGGSIEAISQAMVTNTKEYTKSQQGDGLWRPVSTAPHANTHRKTKLRKLCVELQYGTKAGQSKLQMTNTASVLNRIHTLIMRAWSKNTFQILHLCAHTMHATDTTHTHVYTHARTCTHMLKKPTDVHMYRRAYTYSHKHAHTHLYTCADVHTHAHNTHTKYLAWWMYTCTDVHMHGCTYTHAHNTCTYPHIHTHLCQFEEFKEIEFLW